MQKLKKFSDWLNESKEQAVEDLHLYDIGLLDTVPMVLFSVKPASDIDLHRSDPVIGRVTLAPDWPRDGDYFDLYVSLFRDKQTLRGLLFQIKAGRASESDLIDFVWSEITEIVSKETWYSTYHGVEWNIVKCENTGETRTMAGESIMESTGTEAEEALKLYGYGLLQTYSRVDFTALDQRSLTYSDSKMGEIVFNQAWPNPDSEYEYTLYVTSFADQHEAEWTRRQYYYGTITEREYIDWIWAHIAEPVDKYAPGAGAEDFLVFHCTNTGETRTLDGESLHQ